MHECNAHFFYLFSNLKTTGCYTSRTLLNARCTTLARIEWEDLILTSRCIRHLTISNKTLKNTLNKEHESFHRRGAMVHHTSNAPRPLEAERSGSVAGEGEVPRWAFNIVVVCLSNLFTDESANVIFLNKPRYYKKNKRNYCQVST
jgi:hypothetical protein